MLIFLPCLHLVQKDSAILNYALGLYSQARAFPRAILGATVLLGIIVLIYGDDYNQLIGAVCFRKHLIESTIINA